MLHRNAEFTVCDHSIHNVEKKAKATKHCSRTKLLQQLLGQENDQQSRSRKEQEADSDVGVKHGEVTQLRHTLSVGELHGDHGQHQSSDEGQRRLASQDDAIGYFTRRDEDCTGAHEGDHRSGEQQSYDEVEWLPADPKPTVEHQLSSPSSVGDHVAFANIGVPSRTWGGIATEAQDIKFLEAGAQRVGTPKLLNADMSPDPRPKDSRHLMRVKGEGVQGGRVVPERLHIPIALDHLRGRLQTKPRVAGDLWIWLLAKLSVPVDHTNAHVAHKILRLWLLLQRRKRIVGIAHIAPAPSLKLLAQGSFKSRLQFTRHGASINCSLQRRLRRLIQLRTSEFSRTSDSILCEHETGWTYTSFVQPCAPDQGDLGQRLADLPKNLATEVSVTAHAMKK
mmetsp:Transcript_31401/g.73616  ORF Transcript_31401/g.73616 Transcript_31401/m.73616 type:complete len:394 (-) Transcript_31401:107-1288(-)